MNDQSLKNNENASGKSVDATIRRMSDPVICHNPHCGFQTFDPMTRCPHCKRPMWTTTNFRMVMSVLVVLGFILLIAGVGFGYVAFKTYVGGFESAENEQALFIIMSFLSIFFSSFGVAVMAAGAWAVIFGKANWRIIKVVLGFLAGMLLIAAFGRVVLYILLD